MGDLGIWHRIRRWIAYRIYPEIFEWYYNDADHKDALLELCNAEKLLLEQSARAWREKYYASTCLHSVEQHPDGVYRCNKCGERFYDE
jgi:predicted Fe-S protein YdhL (DUF1289 family)